jgi:hypothetical protein
MDRVGGKVHVKQAQTRRLTHTWAAPKVLVHVPAVPSTCGSGGGRRAAGVRGISAAIPWTNGAAACTAAHPA